MDKGVVNVLLIEDNPVDARLIKEMLSGVNGIPFQLEWAEFLAKGMERLAAEKFDVILLDLSLPDSHGFESFAKTLEAAPDIPIVVMSGLDDEELSLRTVREGAQDYLIKGQTDANLMTRAIRYAIERKEAQSNIKALHGLLPICSACKKIRDDTGYWNRLEEYITDHSEAVFNHSMCPECFEVHYPDFVKKNCR